MSRPVKKLFDMEIDEISLVDRPANQHGLISFSKSAGIGEGHDPKEDSMPDQEIFDAEGYVVDPDTLEHGDVVLDAEGNEYVFVEDENDDDVEKGAGQLGARFGSSAAEAAGAFGAAGKGRMAASRAADKLFGNGGTARKRKLIGAGAIGAGALGGGAYATDKMSKSLGETVLEELSKAVTDREREQIVAKALNEVEVAKAAAAEAWAYAEAERDARLTDEFISKAADYNLPVAPEVFGPILKSLAEALDDDQLAVLDEVFTAVGDALYNEVGYVGESSNSSVLDTVNGLAAEMVGKSALSIEQATVAMFEANPQAYDAYISEMGR